jgi:hypothetical protein
MMTKGNSKEIIRTEWTIKKSKILIIQKSEHTFLLEGNYYNYKYLGMKINLDGPQDLGIQNRIYSGRYANLTLRIVLGDKRVKKKTEQNISQTII